MGTLASRSPGLAAVAMALVAFGVLFAGVVSSVLAGATTSLLLAFILPVSLPGPVSSIPDRLAGWGLASAAALLAIALLWPAPARDPVRSAAIAGTRAVAQRLRAQVAYVLGGQPRLAAERDAAIAQADSAVDALHAVFFATPYRPTGLSTAARTLVRLVDELNWLNAIVLQAAPRPHATAPDPARRRGQDRGRRGARARADLLDAPQRPRRAPRGADRAAARLSELERGATSKLPAATGPASAAMTERPMGDVISSLDPAFRAQELSFVVSQIATNVDWAAAAERRSWLEQMLGRQPEGLAGPVAAAHERAGAHVEPHSLWLQNSIRGAVGLGLAVLIANLAGVQHAFWVVLGTLSVLRSNALSTGQNVLRGLLGTVVGFVVGGVLVALVGTNTTLLWVLLPPAVLFAGLAPAAISFAAGQAAFTLTLLILFNILAPEGWQIGLVRIEDVAIGGAVSLAVGLLFWPRGAGAALGTALAQAYADERGVPRERRALRHRALRRGRAAGARADRGGSPRRRRRATPGRHLPQLPRRARRQARPAGRGHQPGHRRRRPAPRRRRRARPVAPGRLGRRGPDGGATGAVRQHRADDALVPRLRGQPHRPRAGARAAGARSAGDQRLVDAVGHDLRGDDGHATATAVRMIWTGDHLDAARRLQGSLFEPARTAASVNALR